MIQEELEIMKNKKHRLFLGISFTFFAVSVVSILISIVASYYQIQADFPDDSIRAMGEFCFGAVFMTLIAIPFWGVEISFIRSVYKVLKHRPKGIIKICYIVSSALAFLAFAFQCLVSIGLISFQNIGSGDNLTAYILLFTEWSSFILSFVLGSVPVKQLKLSKGIDN